MLVWTLRGKECCVHEWHSPISANQVHNSDVVDFFFCYQRIFWGLGVRFEGKTGRFGFGGIRDTNRLGDEKERKWGKNDRKMCE